jgi:DNA-binding transcriptional LysR family regulator
VVDLTPICHIPLCVVVGADHRFAARKSLRLTECRDEPFIGLREDTFPGRKHLIQSLCTQAGFTPEFAATADSLNSLLALVRSGKGLSLVPRDIQNILPRGLRLVNIRSPICRVEFSAAVRRGEPRPLVLMFLEECRQVAGRVFEHS